MFQCRRSVSEYDIYSSQLSIIDNLLDEGANHIKKSKSTNFQENGNNNSSEENIAENDEINKPNTYWPNVDATVWMRSCDEEVVKPISGQVTGTIPHWLSGSLLRNGPGSLKVGDSQFQHLFDSSALLHRFDISNGNVTYQNRFVQTDTYKKNHAANRIVVTEFGTKAVPDPCESIFARVSAVFNPSEGQSDNSMISIYPIGDEFYTFTEAPVMHRIDINTLDTTGKVVISDYVNIINHTSHPHIMKDGTVYNVGMSFTTRGPRYNVVEFSPSKESKDENEKRDEEKVGVTSMFDQATIVGSVPCRWFLNPSYMHTFGITDNYFIIIEQPLAIAIISAVASKINNGPMATCLKWHSEESTHIHVISRKSGELFRTFVAEGFFFLHVINQFETSDGLYIILDICCYRDAKMLDCMYVDAMQNMHQNPEYCNLFRGRPLRFILPLRRPAHDIPTDFNLILTDSVHKSELQSNTDNGDGQPQFPNNEDKFLWKKASAHRLTNGSVFVKPELLCDLGCETPRINYDMYVGKEYRYFYAMSSDVDLDNPGTIIKVDTISKTKKTWCEKNVYPSEAIFVPHPNGQKEDDGVVLSALIWGQGREKEVGLLILDASTLEEIARVTFVTPSPVPKCLHGWFHSEKKYPQ